MQTSVLFIRRSGRITRNFRRICRNIGRYYGPLYREGQNAEHLLHWENELKEAWGSNFPGGFTILRLTNTELDFRLAAGIRNFAYEVISSSYRYSTVGDYGGQSPKQALTEICQNNLKQLGLSMKMFESEDPNRLVPPGFRQIYPEYVPDLAALTCPSKPYGTLSYDIIYPASNDEFRRQIYSQVEGIPLEDVRKMNVDSRIPIIVELHECSESEGRNVIFVDGHAEWIADTDWDRVIGPYLEYRY